jgi:hypothetical protein
LSGNIVSILRKKKKKIDILSFDELGKGVGDSVETKIPNNSGPFAPIEPTRKQFNRNRISKSIATQVALSDPVQ